MNLTGNGKHLCRFTLKWELKYFYLKAIAMYIAFCEEFSQKMDILSTWLDGGKLRV